MEITTHYITVWAHDAANLDKKVNALLKTGHSLYGNPYAVGVGDGSFVHQAVTKETSADAKAGDK